MKLELDYQGIIDALSSIKNNAHGKSLLLSWVYLNIKQKNLSKKKISIFCLILQFCSSQNIVIILKIFWFPI